MSKRYGRNQKRLHRAEIAHLLRRLNDESTTLLYRPEEGVPELARYATVLDYRVTEEGSAREMVHLSAQVTVASPSNDLMEAMHNGTKVQFMGHQYIIVEGKYMPDVDQGIELELTGISA